MDGGKASVKTDAAMENGKDLVVNGTTQSTKINLNKSEPYEIKIMFTPNVVSEEEEEDEMDDLDLEKLCNDLVEEKKGDKTFVKLIDV